MQRGLDRRKDRACLCVREIKRAIGVKEQNETKHTREQEHVAFLCTRKPTVSEWNSDRRIDVNQVRMKENPITDNSDTIFNCSTSKAHLKIAYNKFGCFFSTFFTFILFVFVLATKHRRSSTHYYAIQMRANDMQTFRTFRHLTFCWLLQ